MSLIGSFGAYRITSGPRFAKPKIFSLRLMIETARADATKIPSKCSGIKMSDYRSTAICKAVFDASKCRVQPEWAKHIPDWSWPALKLKPRRFANWGALDEMTDFAVFQVAHNQKLNFHYCTKSRFENNEPPANSAIVAFGAVEPYSLKPTSRALAP